MKTYLISTVGERREDRLPNSIVMSNDATFLKEYFAQELNEKIDSITVGETDYDENAKFLDTENGRYIVEEFTS